jgi:hypothetical protein
MWVVLLQWVPNTRGANMWVVLLQWVPNTRSAI